MPLGIPHSEFLRWPEPDQDKALAYTTREAQRCSSCGTFSEDWMDGDRPKEVPPYLPDSVHCYGCEALEQERTAIAEYRKDGGRAFHLRLKKNPEAD